MDYGHPLRFGALIRPSSADPHAAIELARLAEERGLDLVTVPDGAGDPEGLDAWSLLAWVAGATSRIEIAGTPLDLSERPPAVLARAAASLDLLSAGRLNLALGAGRPQAARAEDVAASLAHQPTADALEEAISVIRGLWAAGEPPLRHDGRHHRVLGAQRGPAPAHNLPIWIESSDPKLIGAHADGWLAALGPDDDRAHLQTMQALIDEAAIAAGRDPREIRRLLIMQPSPEVTDATIDHLVALAVEDGFATFILAVDDPYQLRRVADQVARAVREAVARRRAATGVVERVVPSLRVRSRRSPAIDYEALPTALRQVAIEPGDARYPNVRSTYMRGGAPGLVLQPRSTAEVVEALAYARSQPVELSIRSGGHGISGRSTNRGGIVIDLGRLNAIEVLDESTRRVRLGPGARWGEVARALQPHGWAISSGDYGGVGVGGLATAGGIGWLVRQHGLTIDHVRSVEMVLADGSVVRADDSHHADLFWAVRGAGANFGIVTSFELEADPVGDIGFAQMTFDASDLAGFLQRWGAAVEAAPRDVTSFLILGRARPGQPLLALAMVAVDSDRPETIVDRLLPIAEIAPLVDRSISVLPYASLMSNAAEGPHSGYGEPVSRSGLIDHITPAFAEDAARLITSGETYFFQIRSAGGAVADVPPDATAYAWRKAGFSVVAFSGSRTRLDAAWDRMAGHFTGLYLSFETDRRPERVLDAFPPDTLRRLQALKRRYDPDNVFRDNFNVAVDAPSARAS